MVNWQERQRDRDTERREDISRIEEKRREEEKKKKKKKKLAQSQRASRVASAVSAWRRRCCVGRGGRERRGLGQSEGRQRVQVIKEDQSNRQSEYEC